ncbi:MAG: hypothetical protein ABEK59_13345, partial [Halobacteria archaeon]
ASFETKSKPPNLIQPNRFVWSAFLRELKKPRVVEKRSIQKSEIFGCPGKTFRFSGYVNL